MADVVVVDEGSAAIVDRGLSALHFWIFDFPQLESHRRRRNEDDADEDDAAFDDGGFAQFDDLEVVLKVVEIAEEICDDREASSSSPVSSPRRREPRRPASASEAWEAVRGILRDNGLDVEEPDDDGGGLGTRRRRQHDALRALLCHALSDGCARQREYVGRIMAVGRPDVQQEIMRMLQENARRDDDDDDEEEDANETADYSFFMEASASGGVSASFEYESNDESDGEMKRNRSEAFGEERLDDSDSPRGNKRHQSSDEDDSPLGDKFSERNTTLQQSAVEDDLRATIAKLHEQLKESRKEEMDLTLKLDEEQSRNRAGMLQMESRNLKAIRDLEEKHAVEISEQKREIETLRDHERNAKEVTEENLRLRDELDVLECSKEKLTYTEEQLRKCREKIELVGDAHSALEREEKAHAASVDRCLALENELARLKPLGRQLEEYRVRATDAEVALAECREDLRRVRERAGGMEGTIGALERGARAQQAEAGNLQKRLQANGGESGGTAVGVGMSELNPELMEELKMLRSEYARLKEFESKREVDSVQRLEESCDDAKRLAERFKEQFIQTKSELEDTRQLLRESEAREATLRKEVEDWSRKHRELGEEMKDERLKSHRAALDAERNFQNQKKGLIEKGRKDLRDLEERLTKKIEAERKQHRERMDRAEAQRVSVENNFSEQITSLREHSSKTLRSTKEFAQKRMDELEQSKQSEIEKMQKERADEIEKLITKGKGMVRDARRETKELKRQITEKYEVQIGSLEEELDTVKTFQQDYEKKANAKISKRDQRIKLLEAKSQQAERANHELEDKAKKADRNSKELAGENDRLRRQLGSRFGGGASQTQLKELASVCKSLREENRRLKASNPDRLLLLAKDEPEPIPRKDDSTRTVSSFDKSTLTQFREEYEERIEALEEEKRDLVMKSSAAATETQKAEQRSWELEEELAKLKSELATTRLALQRNERRDAFSGRLSASSKKRYEGYDLDGKENTPNVRINRPPSGMKRHDFTPIFSEPIMEKKKSPPKSLMEMMSKGNADSAEVAPECKQS